MSEKYRNYTVGLDEITYNQLKDLSMLNRTSIRKYITSVIQPEYDKNKEVIIKLKGVLDSVDSIENASVSTREQQS